MKGMRFQSRLSQYIGAGAALIGIVGYAIFGWRFGGTGSVSSNALGVAVAVFAILWLIYQRT